MPPKSNPSNPKIFKFACFLVICCQFLIVGKVFSKEELYSRREGFLDHQRDQEDYDKERETGYPAFLEEQDQWQQKRLLAMQEQKKQKKAKDDLRGIEAYHNFLKSKFEDFDEYELTRKEYLKALRSEKRTNPSDLNEFEELGLYSNRPRYDYKKRILYGARPHFKSPKFGGSDDYSPSNNSGFSPGFGSGVGGFTPAPTVNDNDFFEPPPPPPPPSFDESDFPPPPPPPPPSFDEGGEGF